MKLPPTIGVAGFGRCGSTMIMGMLDAGGIQPVAGTSEASYELEVDALHALTTADVVGRSVKILELWRYGPLPPAEWRIIWLDRDPLEQAKSQTKFLMSLTPGLLSVTEDEAVRRFAESYNEQRAASLGVLRRRSPVTVIQFERVLANPSKAAKVIAGVCPEWTFDRAAAAAVVHDRGPECLPDLATEIGLSGPTS